MLLQISSYVPDRKVYCNILDCNAKIVCSETSGRNGNSEVPVYFLKEKQGCTVRKIEKGK
jgi:hypothetical protein